MPGVHGVVPARGDAGGAVPGVVGGGELLEVAGHAVLLAQGGGLGRTLTLRALAYLACAEDENGEPLRAIDLYVDADNTTAYSLYTSLGFGVATVDRMYAPAQQDEPAA